MSIKNYFEKELNNDIYNHIIDLVYEKKKEDFIKNCKEELFNKVEKYCGRRIGLYLRDESGDSSHNQLMFYNWIYYLNNDIYNKNLPKITDIVCYN